MDLTRCQGYGQCAFLAPEVFRMRGHEALMDDPDEGQREGVLRAAAACPVQAIRVDRIGSRDAARAVWAPAVAASVPAQRTAPRMLAAGVEAFRRTGRIVIVGGSLAGMAAAAVMRLEGFTGSLTIIGDEPYQPYDRPPLSKQVLGYSIRPDNTGLPGADELNAQWLLGVPATGLDLTGRQVLLADGGAVEFDRLLIATGTRARPWPNDAEAALDGVVVVRTRDDAADVLRRLAGRPRRVLVIGAGFTGSEVASACRGRDLPVTAR